MSQLEEELARAEEKAINAEIENLILVLIIKQTPLEEITQQVKSKYSLTEDVIKTTLNRIQSLTNSFNSH